MSAIFGIFHLTGGQVDAYHLQKMQDKLKHYGRDRHEIMLNKNIGLGCCLDAALSQLPADVPLYDQEDIVVAGDVQIYNRAELMAQLTNDGRISTQALLLAAYKKWGTDCPKFINGDFVFAIWEKQSRQLFIFRDHLGVRPLYYFYNSVSFAFATDLRALLALSFVGRQFDEVILYAIITNTYHIDPEATYFAQIKRLPQACLLKVDARGLYKHKYWTPGERRINFAAEADYAQAMYDLVADAVKIRVANKAKMGAELSGGLDSSVVTILANRELEKEDKQLVLFSWSPPYDLVDKQPGDERQLIELVCKQEGLNCQYYDPRIPLEKNINEILPQFENGNMWQQEYQHMTKQDVKLILTGWGGDQSISHRSNMYALFINGYVRHFWTEAKYLAKGSMRRLFKILIANTIFRLFDPYNYFGNPNKGIPSIANHNFADKLKRHCPKDILYFSSNPVMHIESGNIQTRTEMTAWLGACYNVQHMYPLLDYRVVEFAMSIPRHLYLKRGISRYIFRKAFAPILPSEVCCFLSKNDMAKYMYGIATMAEMADKLRLTASQLQRDLFSSYIDWDKLETVLYNPMLSADLGIYVHTLLKIHPCYYIQQILAEAD